MSGRLNPIQQRVLNEIRISVCQHGKLVTAAQLTEAIPYNSTQVHNALAKLTEKKLVQRHHMWSRTIQHGRSANYWYGLATPAFVFKRVRQQERNSDGVEA